MTVALRKKSRRQKVSYREAPTDSEEELDTPPPKRTLPYRASKASRNPYDETSSESSSDEEVEFAYSRPVTRSTAPAPRSRRVTAPQVQTFNAFKRRKVTHSASHSVKPTISVNIPVRAGRIPKWQQLPYHVLLAIMQFAAYPLYIGASRDTGSMRWLLSTSQLCKSFHDACIGALMFNPPLFPIHRACWLIDLLKASARDYDTTPDTSIYTSSAKCLSLDYRLKVKSLEIEAKQILAPKNGISLVDLLQHTSQLRYLRIYHNHDVFAARHIWALPGNAKGHRWSYGSLFAILDSNNIRLHSFDWNGRFMTDDSDMEKFRQISCNSASLQSLRSITLQNFDFADIDSVPEQTKEQLVGFSDDTQIDPKLRRLLLCRKNVIVALDKLQELKELIIHSCNIVNDDFVEALPAGLTSLTITNCHYFRSDALQTYLEKKGSTITDIVLRGNRTLSLGFLLGLKTNVSHLRNLEIDLNYHDPTSFKETEPLFDELLPSGCPSWPSSLESIIIGPLRNLSAEDAENFYESLVDAAHDLPYLRTLQLRTILNKVGWRDRAVLRRKWDKKINRIFSANENSDIHSPSTSASDSEASQGRKSQRLQELSDNVLNQKRKAVAGQGRCHTIVFDLSDQRPAQDQFTEGDFLDEEDEEDGEWDGRDRVEPPRYSARRYAW